MPVPVSAVLNALHFKQLGFDVGKKYSESRFKFSDIDPKNFRRIQALVKRRYKLKALGFTSSKELLMILILISEISN